MLLGYDSADRSVGEHHRTVEQTIADGDRRADDHKLRPAGSGAGDLPDGPDAGLEEHGLAEEVGAGVAGDAELGKDDDIAFGRQVR